MFEEEAGEKNGPCTDKETLTCRESFRLNEFEPKRQKPTGQHRIFFERKIEQKSEINKTKRLTWLGLFLFDGIGRFGIGHDDGQDTLGFLEDAGRLILRRASK